MIKILFTIILSVILGATYTFAENISIKLGHEAPPEHPYHLAAKQFAKLVNERSNGEIEILIFPSGQLGNQRSLVEGVTLGTIDMALCSTAVLGNFIPEIAIFDLPYIFKDEAHAHKALDTIGMDIAKKGQERGIETLAMWEAGMRHLSNNKKIIKSPDDLKSLKIRVMQNPICVETMKLLGANPTPMSVGEIYLALQNGIVDGQDNTLGQIVSRKINEVQNYLSLTNHAYVAEPLIISKKIWDGFTPEQQQIIKEAAKDAGAWQRNLLHELQGQYLKTIEEAKTTQINSNVDKEAFAKATRPAWDLYINRFGDDNIKAIQEIK